MLRKLYYYALPDQMERFKPGKQVRFGDMTITYGEQDGHIFSDDVAVTYAWSKKQALKKFQRLYGDAADDNVNRVRFNAYGIAILTDY